MLLRSAVERHMYTQNMYSGVVCSALKPTNHPLANQLTNYQWESWQKGHHQFICITYSLGSTFTLAKQILKKIQKFFWILKLLFFHDLPSSNGFFFWVKNISKMKKIKNNNNQGIFCHQNAKIKIKENIST